MPRASMCSILSAPHKLESLKGLVPEDAVEALAKSLGTKEADPEYEKSVEDNVKEKFDGKAKATSPKHRQAAF